MSPGERGTQRPRPRWCCSLLSTLLQLLRGEGSAQQNTDELTYNFSKTFFRRVSGGVVGAGGRMRYVYRPIGLDLGLLCRTMLLARRVNAGPRALLRLLAYQPLLFYAKS